MKTRESNYELLRILSMIMIVAYHTFRYIDTSSFSYWQMVAYHGVRWYGLFGVNCFVMISAWFMIGRPIQTKRLFPLILQTMFYCVAIFLCHIIAQLLQGHFHFYQDVIAVEMDAILSPLWASRYWFITAYVGMFLLVPLMNSLIQKLSHRGYRSFLLVTSILLFLYQSLPQSFDNTTVLSDIAWLLYVYLLTGYLKLYAHDNLIKRHPGKILLLTYIAFVISKTLCTFHIKNEFVNYLLSRTFGSSMRYSYMMLLLAVSLFYLFQRIHFTSKTVNTIASCTFGVYLFHENKVFHICELAAKIWQTAFVTVIPSTGLFMLLLLLGLYLAGTLIELLRQRLIARHLDPVLCKPLEPLFQKWDRLLNRL